MQAANPLRALHGAMLLREAFHRRRGFPLETGLAISRLDISRREHLLNIDLQMLYHDNSIFLGELTAGFYLHEHRMLNERTPHVSGRKGHITMLSNIYGIVHVQTQLHMALDRPAKQIPYKQPI